MIRPNWRIAAVALLVVTAACSGGVSDEDYQAALDAERSANETIGSLESELSRTEAELVTAQEDAQARAGENDTLSSNLEAAQSDLDEARQTSDETAAELADARDSIEELRQLPALSTGNGSVLFSVQAAGTVRCGVNSGFNGFSVVQPGGSASGFDVDFCRAIAAAALGDADAVEYVPLTAAERFTALQIGLVDVLVRNTTHTLFRTAELGIDFGPTIYFDGQQFMGLTSRFGDGDLTGLDGARLCVPPGSLLESRAIDFASALGVQLTLVPTDSPPASMNQLKSGICDLVTTDGTALGLFQSQAIADRSFRAGDLTIFPPIPISKEPLAPAVLQGDTFWRDVVDWAVYTTLIAEEKGITSRNIDSTAWDADISRLFGVDGESALQMGLTPDAFYQVIRQVGNYQEIWDRHLPALGLVREGSFNQLWFDGGLFYAPRV
jgi:general L-amino acid transport system substrate-binding protein